MRHSRRESDDSTRAQERADALDDPTQEEDGQQAVEDELEEQARLKAAEEADDSARSAARRQKAVEDLEAWKEKAYLDTEIGTTRCERPRRDAITRTFTGRENQKRGSGDAAAEGDPVVT